jgi:hypothetical protein
LTPIPVYGIINAREKDMKPPKWSQEWIRLRTDAQLVKDREWVAGNAIVTGEHHKKSHFKWAAIQLTIEEEILRRVALRIPDPRGLQAPMIANAKVAKKVIE